MKIRFIGKSLGRIIIILLVIAVIAGGVWAWKKGWFVKDSSQNTSQAQDDNKQLIDAVAKLMELPADELPSVATVTDKEKLKDEQFFARAEINDKLLIYPTSHIAIIYRPSTNKIVNVAPLSGDTATETQPSTQIAATTKVALYNGTNSSGLTNTAEEKLKQQVTGVEITAKEKAQKNNYNKTIVVDINGQMGAKAQEIATALGGEVSTLPAGEIKPSADIMVIVAN